MQAWGDQVNQQMEFAKSLSGSQKLHDVSKASNRKLQRVSNAMPPDSSAAPGIPTKLAEQPASEKALSSQGQGVQVPNAASRPRFTVNGVLPPPQQGSAGRQEDTGGKGAQDAGKQGTDNGKGKYQASHSSTMVRYPAMLSVVFPHKPLSAHDMGVNHLEVPEPNQSLKWNQLVAYYPRECIIYIVPSHRAWLTFKG